MSPALPLLVLLCRPAAAQPSFDAARADYDAGRYEEAARGFAAAAAADPGDAAARYNLGNALLKSGALGRAAASYERAFRLAPRDPDVRFNLAFALRRAGEELAPPGVPPAAFAAFTVLSGGELAGLLWLAAWAALLLAAGALALPARRGALAPWAAGAAAAWLAFALWRTGLEAALPPDAGVLVAPAVELRHGPGTSFPAAFSAPEGRRVRVLGRSGGWLEVALTKEGARGWAPAPAVEPL